MSRSELPKQQHYVPQFLLRGFAAGKHHQVFVFDKRSGRTFRTAVRNVAAENGFYNLDSGGDQPVSLEPALSRLEHETSDIIRRIRQDESLASVEPKERALLGTFALAQWFRTQNQRARVMQMHAALRGRTGRMRPAASGAEDQEAEERQAKVSSLFLLIRAHEFAPMLLDKVWFLNRNHSPSPFYISDNPFVLHNDRDFGGYGNLGLAVPGIQLILPLSSTLTLHMVCPSLLTSARASVRTLDRLRTASPIARAPVQHEDAARALLHAMEASGTFDSAPDNVKFNNSLQVMFAERYVYSQVDEFGLIREMLANDPSLTAGPRLRID